jgi:hypothetical protein
MQKLEFWGKCHGCFYVFYFYLYVQGGGGDSSGNAIPEEWAASLQFKGTIRPAN